MVVCGLRLTGFFQFCDDGVAKPAADRFQMELDILTQRVVQNSQQVAAERGSCWAAQPMTAPDFSDCVTALITASNQHGKSLSHVGRVAKLFFQKRRSFNGKLLVEKRQKFVVGKCDSHRNSPESADPDSCCGQLRNVSEISSRYQHEARASEYSKFTRSRFVLVLNRELLLDTILTGRIPGEFQSTAV